MSLIGRLFCIIVFLVYFFSMLGLILFIALFYIIPSTRIYIGQLLISIDQQGNVLLGGSADETISSRAGRAKKYGTTSVFAKAMYTFVDWAAAFLFNDINHCEKSIESPTHLNQESWHWSEK